MKEYKITYEKSSYYAGMYDTKNILVTIIEANSSKEAVEKFYEEYKDVKGKGITSYKFIDINLL